MLTFGIIAGGRQAHPDRSLVGPVEEQEAHVHGDDRRARPFPVEQQGQHAEEHAASDDDVGAFALDQITQSLGLHGHRIDEAPLELMAEALRAGRQVGITVFGGAVVWIGGEAKPRARDLHGKRRG